MLVELTTGLFPFSEESEGFELDTPFFKPDCWCDDPSLFKLSDDLFFLNLFINEVFVLVGNGALDSSFVLCSLLVVSSTSSIDFGCSDNICIFGVEYDFEVIFLGSSSIDELDSFNEWLFDFDLNNDLKLNFFFPLLDFRLVLAVDGKTPEEGCCSLFNLLKSFNVLLRLCRRVLFSGWKSVDVVALLFLRLNLPFIIE